MKGLGRRFLRGRIWWIDYSIRGKRYFESTHSTKESVAIKLLRNRIKKAESGERVGHDIDRITLAAMLDRVVDDYKINERRSLNRFQIARANLVRHFGGDMLAVDITDAAIAEYAAARKELGRSNGCINRELGALKHGFRLSRKNLSSIPDIRMLKESPARAGFVSPSEFARLQAELPADLRDVIAFLFFSSWRVGEALSLQWRDVNLDTGLITLRAEHSKNSTPRTLPLVLGELRGIIERAAERRQLDCEFIFHRYGRQIRRIHTTIGAWRSACHRAGLPGLLIHDLRRSAIKNMIDAGIDPKVVMMVSGHKTFSVLMRYNIRTDKDVVAAFEKLETHLANAPESPRKVVPIASRQFARQP